MKFDFDKWEKIFREFDPSAIYIFSDKKISREIDKLRLGKGLPIYLPVFIQKEDIKNFVNMNYFPEDVLFLFISGWEKDFEKESIDLINNYVDNFEEV